MNHLNMLESFCLHLQLPNKETGDKINVVCEMYITLLILIHTYML